MSWSSISPDEIRGREAVRKAVEEARQEQRRKHKLLDGEVQEGTDKFLHGTDGVHFSGVKILVEKKHLRSITDQEKRIETMKDLGMDEDVIKHAQKKLKRDRTLLLCASFRGPSRVEITDHREERREQGLGSKLRGLFGGRATKDEIIEVEAEE